MHLNFNLFYLRFYLLASVNNGRLHKKEKRSFYALTCLGAGNSQIHSRHTYTILGIRMGMLDIPSISY